MIDIINDIITTTFDWFTHTLQMAHTDWLKITLSEGTKIHLQKIFHHTQLNAKYPAKSKVPLLLTTSPCDIVITDLVKCLLIKIKCSFLRHREFLRM